MIQALSLPIDREYPFAEYTFSQEISTMFDEAEAFFVSQRYPEAIRSYQKIIDRFPDRYLAYSGDWQDMGKRVTFLDDE